MVQTAGATSGKSGEEQTGCQSPGRNLAWEPQRSQLRRTHAETRPPPGRGRGMEKTGVRAVQQPDSFIPALPQWGQQGWRPGPAFRVFMHNLEYTKWCGTTMGKQSSHCLLPVFKKNSKHLRESRISLHIIDIQCKEKEDVKEESVSYFFLMYFGICVFHC